MKRTPEKGVFHQMCLGLLASLSAGMSIPMFPDGPWIWPAMWGTFAVVAMFLRVGWVVTMLIAGIYSGLILDAEIKGGSIVSQTTEMVTNLLTGVGLGLLSGLAIDLWVARDRKRRRRRKKHFRPPATARRHNM